MRRQCVAATSWLLQRQLGFGSFQQSECIFVHEIDASFSVLVSCALAGVQVMVV